MKKFTTTILTTLILAASVGATFAQPFSDVQDNYVYKDAIEYMKTNNIVSGFSDGEFKPDRTITRAEFTKILINAKYKESIEQGLCGEFGMMGDDRELQFVFSDVALDTTTPTGSYLFGNSASKFWEEICVAKKLKIINGYSDGTFRPEQPITVAEASKIIANTYGLTNNPVTSGDHKFKPFIDALANKKAIPTSLTSLDTKLNRGEMSEIIYRLMTNNQKKITLTYDNLFNKIPYLQVVNDDLRIYQTEPRGNILNQTIWDKSKWEIFSKGGRKSYNGLYSKKLTNHMDAPTGQVEIIDPRSYERLGYEGESNQKADFRYLCSFNNNKISDSIRNSLSIGEAVIDIDMDIDSSSNKILVNYNIGPDDYIGGAPDFYKLDGIQRTPIFDGTWNIVGSMIQPHVNYYGGKQSPVRAMICEKINGYYEVSLMGIAVLDRTNSIETEHRMITEMLNVLNSYIEVN